MAMARYNPTARAASRTMPSNGNGQQGGYIDYRDPSMNGAFYPGTTRQQYQDDPNARKLHTPGSDRGAHTGFRPPTPSIGGPVGTPESDAAWEEMRKRTEAEAFARRGMPYANMQEWKNSDPQYVALRDAFNNATDPRTRAQALKAANDYDTQRQMQFKDQNALKAFIAQGGTEDTYRNRFDPNNNWPVPRSPSGNYQYGPGRPGPTPPNVAQSAPSGVRRGATPQAGSLNVSAGNAPAWVLPGAPPSQNPMMQGYQSAYPQGGYMGGGAGVPTGSGWGSAGGMPGVPSGGGWGSAGGNPMVSSGSDLNRWLAMQGGGNYMDMNPNVAAGRAALGLGEYGRSPMGYGGYNPMMGGGGSGWGGMQPGYAPFDAGNYSMPYDMMGMGQWY